MFQTLFLFGFVHFLLVHAKRRDWTNVERVLETAIENKIFPGCSALVVSKDEIVFEKYLGHYEYPDSRKYRENPSVSEKSLYDLASVTKVLSTTSGIEQFYARKELKLTDRVKDFFPTFKHADITIENCLLHNAGFPPDPTPYWYYMKKFGCLASQKTHPELTFDCYQKVKEAWLTQDLIYTPGSKFVYSDLSMITLHFVIGHLAKTLKYVTSDDLLPGCPHDSETCYYEAYMRLHFFDALSLNHTLFVPSISKKHATCVPTWFDDYYRHSLIQCSVSDENSYAQGGVSGHAGLFSTLREVGTVLREFMWRNKVVPRAVVEEFIKVKNVTQSNRAFGWGTNAYKDTNCEPWSKETYYHLGYTGTNVCNDPKKRVVTILLTNRCYPNKTGHLYDVNTVIKHFNQEVEKLF